MFIPFNPEGVGEIRGFSVSWPTRSVLLSAEASCPGVVLWAGIGLRLRRKEP